MHLRDIPYVYTFTCSYIHTFFMTPILSTTSAPNLSWLQWELQSQWGFRANASVVQPIGHDNPSSSPPFDKMRALMHSFGNEVPATRIQNAFALCQHFSNSESIRQDQGSRTISITNIVPKGPTYA